MPEETPVDYLDEDAMIASQQYFILSYILPTSDSQYPMIKVRGSYATQEECQKRIKRLQISDGYHNMYTCQVGFWGSLVPYEQLQKEDGIDVVFREKEMNEMMKNFKDNKDNANMHFEDRRQRMKEMATEEGTSEGQRALAEAKTNPVVVKNMIENTDKEMDGLAKQLKELQEIKEKLTLKLQNEYTEEEIEEAKEEIAEYQEKFSKGDVDVDSIFGSKGEVKRIKPASGSG